MKSRSVQSKWDRDLIVFFGTDIPPMGFGELMIWGRIVDLIQQKQTCILSTNEIFEGYTHTNRGRFDLISRLVSRKSIRRTRINSTHHEYTIIPKNTYKDGEEMRVYTIKTRKDRFELLKEFNVK